MERIKEGGPRSKVSSLRGWLKTALIASIAGAALATPMAYTDWSKNPGGVFRSAGGTQWGLVWDTWVSWFAPTALAAVLLATLVSFLIARRH